MTTKASNDNGIRSREQLKKIRKNERETNKQIKDNKIEKTAENKTKNSKEKRQNRIKIRIIPIWLRLFIVALLVVASVALGAIVGYSVIGEGKATDVFNKETWTHIVDLINKE